MFSIVWGIEHGSFEQYVAYFGAKKCSAQLSAHP